MRLISLGVFTLSLTYLAYSHTQQTTHSENVQYDALTVSHEGQVIHLQGKAQLSTSSVTISGDDIYYDEGNRQVTSDGHVKVALKN